MKEKNNRGNIISSQLTIDYLTQKVMYFPKAWILKSICSYYLNIHMVKGRFAILWIIFAGLKSHALDK